MSSIDIKLDDAVNRGLLDQVKELLEKGADIEYVDSFGNTPLMNAAWVASNDVVFFLLSQGANRGHKNHDGLTALELIKTIGHNDHGHDEVIEMLQSKNN